MTKVRQDTKGLYVKKDGAKARPGNVVGYDHAFDMSDGGLVVGDFVKTSHPAGPITYLTLEDGHRLAWYRYEHDVEIKQRYKYQFELPNGRTVTVTDTTRDDAYIHAIQVLDERHDNKGIEPPVAYDLMCINVKEVIK